MQWNSHALPAEPSAAAWLGLPQRCEIAQIRKVGVAGKLRNEGKL